MPNYAIVYYGEAQFDSPEAGKAYQEKWRAWMGTVGDAWVNMGTFLDKAERVNADSEADTDVATRFTGLSVIIADSLEAAIGLTKGCPHLEHGTIDVAEVGMQM